MFNSWQRNLRSYFYGFVMALGLVFLQQLGATSSFTTFLLGLLVLELVLLMEIYTTFRYASSLLRQLDLPSVEIYKRNAQLVYHLLLPTLTYFGLAGFIYTNNISSLTLVYFFVSWLLFALLFINIRAYYEDKFKLEKQTHVVYDLIKITLFFTITDTILNLSSRYDFNFFVLAGLVFCLTSLLTLLIFLRYSGINQLFNIVLILLAGLTIGYLTATLQVFLDQQNLLVAFYSALVFYIFNAILHHELAKTLRIATVLEYILVAIICFLIILLI
jgi:hypothetical protein